MSNTPVAQHTLALFTVLLLGTTGCSDGPSGLERSAAALAPTEPDAAMAQVDVCHRNTSGSFVAITIADAAYQTHLDHGDGAIGDPVPGMDRYSFDATCQPVRDPYCPCYDYDTDFGYSDYGYWLQEGSDEAIGSWWMKIYSWDFFAGASFDGHEGACEMGPIGGSATTSHSPISEADADVCVAVLHDVFWDSQKGW